jgi:hypothetical protein
MAALRWLRIAELSICGFCANPSQEPPAIRAKSRIENDHLLRPGKPLSLLLANIFLASDIPNEMQSGCYA